MANFNSTLGLRTEGDSIVLETRPEHEVIPGMIHFAVLTTIAEVSAAHAVSEPVVPSTVTIHLMRPAKAGTLTGKGTVLKRGKRLTTAEGEVTQDGKLVAKATISFAMMG